MIISIIKIIVAVQPRNENALLRRKTMYDNVSSDNSSNYIDIQSNNHQHKDDKDSHEFDKDNIMRKKKSQNKSKNRDNHNGNEMLTIITIQNRNGCNNNDYRN